MLMGVTLDGQFKYKDGSDLPNQQAKVEFTSNPTKPGEIPLAAPLAFQNRSGVNNTCMAYAHRSNQFNSCKSGVYESQTEAQVNSIADYFNMEKRVHQALIGSAPTSFMPPDVGNMHPNYLQAVYNNRRSRAFLSVRAHAVTVIPANIDLFDIVNIGSQSAAHVESDPKAYYEHTVYNGKYIVAGKTIYLNNGLYYEKYAIVRQGPSIDSFDGNAREQIIPAVDTTSGTA